MIEFGALIDAAAVYGSADQPEAAGALLRHALRESEARGAWAYAAQAREALAGLDGAGEACPP